MWNGERVENRARTRLELDDDGVLGEYGNEVLEKEAQDVSGLTVGVGMFPWAPWQGMEARNWPGSVAGGLVGAETVAGSTGTARSGGSGGRGDFM